MNTATARTRLQTFTLIGAAATTVLAGAPLAPVLPAMEEAFAEIPDAERWVKLVLTLPGICIAGVAPLWGALLDRVSKASVLLVAAVVFALGGASAYWLSESLLAILATRALVGVAVAGLWTAGTALVSERYHGPHLHRMLGLQAAGGAYAGVAFVLLGGVLAEIDWPLPFLLHVVGLLLVPGAWLALRRRDSLDAITALPPASLPHRRLMGLWFALAAVEILLLYAVPVHYPFYLVQLGAGEATWSGLGIALMMLVMAVGSTGYRHLRARLSFVRVHALGYVVLGLGYGALAAAVDAFTSWAALLVVGLGFGMLRPNLMAWVASATPPAVRGRVFGAVTTCFFVGQFVCPWITQPIVEGSSVAHMFAVLGGVGVALGASFLIARETKPPPEREAPLHGEPR